jgi:type II restriction enzyme
VDDIPGKIGQWVLPHFGNYDRIFTLRCYPDPHRKASIRYDLREIPKELLAQIGFLLPMDFSPLTKTNTTSAIVRVNGRAAFKFRLDGSDDKLTITALDVDLCPLHAWWSLPILD